MADTINPHFPSSLVKDIEFTLKKAPEAELGNGLENAVNFG
jgi:hypothetical protein